MLRFRRPRQARRLRLPFDLELFDPLERGFPPENACKIDNHDPWCLTFLGEKRRKMLQATCAYKYTIGQV